MWFDESRKLGAILCCCGVAFAISFHAVRVNELASRQQRVLAAIEGRHLLVGRMMPGVVDSLALWQGVQVPDTPVGIFLIVGAHGCLKCLDEISRMSQVAERVRGLGVTTILVGESEDVAHRMMAEEGPAMRVLADPDGRVPQALGLTAGVTLRLVSLSGRIHIADDAADASGAGFPEAIEAVGRLGGLDGQYDSEKRMDRPGLR
jgi:hypothetical protein